MLICQGGLGGKGIAVLAVTCFPEFAPRIRRYQQIRYRRSWFRAVRSTRVIATGHQL